MQESRSYQAEIDKVPWDLRDVLGGIGLAIALTIILLSLIIGFIVFLAGIGTEWPVETWFILTFILAGILLYAAMALSVWIFSIRKYGCSWRELGFRPFRAVRGLPLAAGVIAVGILINYLYDLLISSLGEEPTSTLPQYLTGDWFFLAIFAFFAIAVAPIAEELFFRGFLFSGISKRYGYTWGILVSAVLFALAHMDPAALVPIFILGMLLAWLYKKTGSIWTCIITHFTYNSIALLLFILYYY